MSNEAAVDRSDVEAHLDRLLASETFRGADRSRRLLRFIVVETLEGRADRLKDYTLGSEGLGRGDDFDPRTDPIARVEASRLRTRLEVYYATEGASEPVRILLPKGGYVPRFERLDKNIPDAVTALPTPASPGGLLRSAALVVAAAVLAVSAWAVGRHTAAPAPPEMRLEITTPPTTDPASLAIAPDGEVLTRGPHVMAGYWNNPQATAEAIRDGWLHTGDLGQLDADGYLSITGRKKELLVLSSGKKVVPPHIEGLILADPCIDQVVVHGEGRNFLTALIVPHWANLRDVLKKAGHSAPMPIDIDSSSAPMVNSSTRPRLPISM